MKAPEKEPRHSAAVAVSDARSRAAKRQAVEDLARVVIIGTSGSGKTTFARRLAGILDAPHIELDAVYWKKDWVARDRDEFRALVAPEVARERWVLDGNYSAVRDIAWPRASAAVWLDFPFLLVFWRVLWRTVRRAVTRETIFSDNTESLRMSFFSQDSLLWWVITTYSRRRLKFRALFESGAYPNLALIELQHPREAEAFLESLSQAQAT